VNEVLREVIAEELERLADADERLRLLTVTGVVSEPDLRHAKVLFASLEAPADEALVEVRVRLQTAISSQVRLKRTPLLAFGQDPAIVHGTHIEAILRRVAEATGGPASEDS
jgi:ribosome-binding factor A